MEIHNFDYDYISVDAVSLEKLEKYLVGLLKNKSYELNEAGILLVGRHLQRVRFYLRLKRFGFEMHLKPVKLYDQNDGTTKRKANCDVDMAFYLMKEKDKFDTAIILSGDGDFLPVLKYLKHQGKRILILARGQRTAREIRRFAGGDFRDFEYLKHLLQMEVK